MTQSSTDSLKDLDARIATLRAQGKDVSALEQKRATDAAALKAQSGDNVGLVDPQNKDQAAAAKAGRDFANGEGVVEKVTQTASDGVSAIGDAIGGLFGGDDDGDAAKGKSGKFRWGNTIAGVLGVGGAYLLSSIFGGGWLGTVMFALFAIPAFMMGRSQLGGTLSRWFGEAPSQDSPAKGNEVQLAQSQSVSGVANATVPQVPQQPTPHQQLQADVMEVAQKSQIARAAILQQAQSGELNPRRAQTLMNQVGQAQQMVQQMQGVDISRLSPEQLRAIDREFGQAEAALDRAINTNPIIAAQIQQSVVQDTRAILSQQAPSNGAQWFQPSAGVVNDQRPVFAGSPQNTIGAKLTPEAQMQLQSVRQSGQYYQYQPAQQGAAEPQRFSGLPDQQGFALPDAYIPR